MTTRTKRKIVQIFAIIFIIVLVISSVAGMFGSL